MTTLTDFIFVLDVSEELELENFKAFCEIESGFPASEIMIAFNGMPLMDNKKSLKDLGIRDGDAVILQHMLSRSQTNIEQNSSGKDFELTAKHQIIHSLSCLQFPALISAAFKFLTV